MFLLFLISIAFACRAIHEERNIFPTQGEYYTIEMDQLFENGCDQFECTGCSDEISINNAYEIAYSQELNYTFLNVIWNSTHFAGLTDQFLVIYQQSKQTFEIQVMLQNSLPSNYTCLNLIFTNNGSIVMLDCYSVDTLVFFQLIGDQFVQAYNISNYQPLSSKFQHYIQQQQEYLLYGQFYQFASVLTIFQQQEDNNQYVNQSNYNCSEFKDFLSTLNFIYIYHSSYIYLFQINNSEFQCNQNITYNSFQDITLFTAFSSITRAYGCDQLITTDGIWVMSYNFFGCVFPKNESYINFLSSISNIKLNSDFIFLWNSSFIAIMKNDNSLQILSSFNLNEQSILILDDMENIVYMFGNEYNFINIQIPSLTINATYLQISQQNLTLYASYYSQKSLKSINQTNIIQYQKQQKLRNINTAINASVIITVQILNDSDTNIYVQFYSNKTFNFLQFNYSITFDFQNNCQMTLPYYVYLSTYSGQLLNISIKQFTKTPYFGQFKETTLTQLYMNLTDFDICQILQIPFISQFWLVCFLKNEITYFICSQYCNNCQVQFKTNISNISQLQLAFNQQNETITAILQEDSIIISLLFYNQNFSIFSIYYQNNITLNVAFSSYLVNYAGLFILYQNQSINFYSNYSQSQVLIIDQNLINKIFNHNQSYSFNPVGMTQNIQFLSSILFINNQSNVLLVSIIQTEVIPISRIFNLFNNTNSIYGINIVNERLIITFYSNNISTFQVWNLYNIYKPYYEKQLMPIYTDNLIKLYSDNLFFYVQFNETQLYIYNPALSQHSALLTNLSYNGITFISSTAFFPNKQNQIYYNSSLPYTLGIYQETQSILMINNDLYLLNPTIQFQFFINSSFENEGEYPSVYYNYSVSSYFSNNKLFEKTNILVFLNQFLTVYPKKFSYNLSGENIISTIVSNNSQLSNCSSGNKQLQFYKDSNTSCLSNELYLLTFIEDRVIYLDNSSLYNLSINTKQCIYTEFNNYSNLNFGLCLQSTSQSLSIYLICMNSSSTYLIQFNFTDKNYQKQPDVWDLAFNLTDVSNIQFSSLGIYFMGTQYIGQVQLYLFQYLTNKTQNFTDKSNFISYAQFEMNFYFTKFSFIIFMYKKAISFEVYDSNFTKIQNQTYIQIPLVYDQNPLFQEIILISQQYNNVIVFLTSSKFQFPFIKLYFYIQLNENGKIDFTHEVQILKLLPSQPFTITTNTQQLNGYLLIIYPDSGHSINYLSIYNITDIQKVQITDLHPVLLLKQLKLGQIFSYTGSFITASYNTSSELITIVYYTNKTQQEYQYVNLQVNPKLQFISKNLIKEYECCSFDSQYNYYWLKNCNKFTLDQQPKIYWNLILVIINISLLTACLCYNINQKLKKYPQLQMENEIEL